MEPEHHGKTSRGNPPLRDFFQREPVTTGIPEILCPKNAHHGMSPDVHEPPPYPFFSSFVQIINRYHVPSGTFACTILAMRLRYQFHTSTEHNKQKLSILRFSLLHKSRLQKLTVSNRDDATDKIRPAIGSNSREMGENPPYTPNQSTAPTSKTGQHIVYASRSPRWSSGNPRILLALILEC